MQPPTIDKKVSQISASTYEAKVGTERQRLRAISDALSHFRELSPTMPVGEISIFLTAALNEGASLKELAELSDMRLSTASRYLLNLSDKTRKGGAGYQLLSRESDPDELRRNMYSLTAKGRKVVAKLVASKDQED